MARALRLISGREPAMVWHAETALPAGTDLVVVPGGFSYGDYLRCGAIAARAPIMDAVRAHRRRRRPGARRLQRLPDPLRGRAAAGRADAQRARSSSSAATSICAVERSDTPFTRGYNAGQVIRVPVAHGEGNYIADARDHRAARRRGAGAVPLCRRPTAASIRPGTSTAPSTRIAGIVNERRQRARHDAASGKPRRARDGRDRRPRTVRGAGGSFQQAA